MPSGALVCTFHLEYIALNKKKLIPYVTRQGHENSYYEVADECKDSFNSFLKNKNYSALLTNLLEDFGALGKKNITVIGIRKLQSKHYPIMVSVSYSDSNGENEKTYFLKTLRKKQYQSEVLTQEFLDLLDIPHIKTYMRVVGPDKYFYISEEYPSTMELTEMDISKKTRSIIINDLAKSMATWYLYGKTDYFHNQLYSTKDKSHLIQLDNENHGYPLYNLTHPAGFDYDKIGKGWKIESDKEGVIKALKLLEVGFSSENSEGPNEELQKKFIQELEYLVKKISGSSRLQEILTERLKTADALLFQDALSRLVSKYPILFEKIFPGSNTLIPLNEEHKKYRKKWENYCIKQVVEKEKTENNKDIPLNRKFFSEKQNKEVKILLAQFPQDFTFNDYSSVLDLLSDYLPLVGYSKSDSIKIIRENKKQLQLTYNIWKKIMNSNMVIELAKNNVFL